MKRDPIKELPETLLVLAYQGMDGCDELAWSRADAFAVLAFLENSSIGVLGGDVLYRSSGLMSPAYANWSSNIRSDEIWSDYVARSHKETKAYLNNFPDPENGTIAYVLVLSDGV